MSASIKPKIQESASVDSLVSADFQITSDRLLKEDSTEKKTDLQKEKIAVLNEDKVASLLEQVSEKTDLPTTAGKVSEQKSKIADPKAMPSKDLPKPTFASGHLLKPALPVADNKAVKTPERVRQLAKVLNSPTTGAKVAAKVQPSPQRRTVLTQGLQALKQWRKKAQKDEDAHQKVMGRCLSMFQTVVQAATAANLNTVQGQVEICDARDLKWYRRAHDDILTLVQKGTSPQEKVNHDISDVYVNITHLTAPTANGTGWHYVKPGDPNAKYLSLQDRVENNDTGVYITSFQLPGMANKKFSTFFSGFTSADDLVAGIRKSDTVTQFHGQNFLLKITTPSGLVYYAESAVDYDDPKRHHTMYPLFRVIDLTTPAPLTSSIDLIKQGEWKDQPTYSFAVSLADLKKDVWQAVRYFNKKPQTYCPVRYKDGDRIYVDVSGLYKWKESQKSNPFPLKNGIFIELDVNSLPLAWKKDFNDCFILAGF